MRSKSRGFFADLHKPAALRLFLHIMICCGLLKVLQDDRRAIFAAAAHAQRAVAYLHGLQPLAESEREAA